MSEPRLHRGHSSIPQEHAYINPVRIEATSEVEVVVGEMGIVEPIYTGPVELKFLDPTETIPSKTL